MATPRPLRARSMAALLPRVLLLAPLLAVGLVSCGGSPTDSTSGSGSNPPPAPTVPGTPTLAAATAGDAIITLTFTAPSSNGGSTITGYAATCTPSGGAVRTQSGTASPIAVGGLANGTTYDCAVSAANAVGLGVASTTPRVVAAMVGVVGIAWMAARMPTAW